MLNQSITFNAFINGKWQNIFMHGDHLSMNNMILKLSQKIRGISLGKDKLFLVFEPNESKEIVSFDDLPRNNIVAYDYNGNYLYNIGDIVPRAETYDYALIRSFDNGINISPNKIIKTIKDHEYLTCTSVHSVHYIIDITENRFVTTQDSR